MKFQLFFITFIAIAVQGETKLPFSVLHKGETAFDGVTNLLTKSLNDFNLFIEKITQKTSNAISTTVEASYHPVYDMINQLSGSNECVQNQRNKADADVESLISAGTHCISNIVIDILSNTLDIVNAIVANKNSAASAIQSLKTCYTKTLMKMPLCVTSRATAATLEAGEQDIQAGTAIAKLATFRERTVINLQECYSRQVATAAVNVARILAALSKC